MKNMVKLIGLIALAAIISFSALSLTGCGDGSGGGDPGGSMATAIPLTVNQWADGNLPTSSDEQWFRFTATATTQYIHFSPGTVLYVQLSVYDSSGTVVSEAYLDSSTRSVSRPLTSGQTYYIRVRPYNTYSGTYKIGFNTTLCPPGVIPLTENQWADGNLPTYESEQWFRFTATASTQWIHAAFGTLTNLYVKVYDSSSASLPMAYLDSDTSGTSLTLVSGQTYYIRVIPSGDLSGTYRIVFNTTLYPPGIIPLTENQWADGNLPTSSDEQWFKFTATASTQRIHFFLDAGTQVNFWMYDSDYSGGIVTGIPTDGGGVVNYELNTLTPEQTYYLKVILSIFNNSNSIGNYKIAFNTSTTAPTLP